MGLAPKTATVIQDGKELKYLLRKLKWAISFGETGEKPTRGQEVIEGNIQSMNLC